MDYVRLSTNLYIHHVRLSRNLYIHYVRLSTSYNKCDYNCDDDHQREAGDEQQQGKAQQLGRGTASGEGVFFQMYQMAKRDDINILVLLNS